MKKNYILLTFATLVFSLFTVQVQATTEFSMAQAEPNPQLLGLVYQIDNGESKSGGGYFSLDSNRFQFHVFVDLNKAGEWKDFYGVTMGPWVDKFQVWLDGDEVSLALPDFSSYSCYLDREDYGERVNIRVRVEGQYTTDEGTEYIYNELELDIGFADIVPTPVGLFIIVVLVVVCCVIGIVVVHRRRNGEPDIIDHVILP